jgi:hypothetical protein
VFRNETWMESQLLVMAPVRLPKNKTNERIIEMENHMTSLTLLPKTTPRQQSPTANGVTKCALRTI